MEVLCVFRTSDDSEIELTLTPSPPEAAVPALFYIPTMRCDFHVEGSRGRWSQDVDATPQIGDTIEHRRKTYTVIDVVGSLGEDRVLVTVRRRIDESALV
jgi:hypothetical protein